MNDDPAQEYTTWQDHWEAAARAESQTYHSQSVETLLENVRNGYFGGYYNIWPAIAQKATLKKAGWTLYSVLISQADYLDRYHCAAALLKLLGRTRFQPVHLSAESEQLQANLDTLREILVKKIG